MLELRILGILLLALPGACRSGPSKEELAAAISAGLNPPASAKCTVELGEATLWGELGEVPYVCPLGGNAKASGCIERMRSAGLLTSHTTPGCATLRDAESQALESPGRVVLEFRCATFSKPVVHSIVREGDDRVKVDYTLELERRPELESLASACEKLRWPTEPRKETGTFVRRNDKWEVWGDEPKSSRSAVVPP